MKLKLIRTDLICGPSANVACSLRYIVYQIAWHRLQAAILNPHIWNCIWSIFGIVDINKIIFSYSGLEDD